jgi:hypothetical protein
MTDYDYDALEPTPGNPDAGLTELGHYEAYLRQELPYSVRQELELRLENLLENVEETLRDELSTILRDLQLRHYQEYLEQRRGSQRSPLERTATDAGGSTDPVQTVNRQETSMDDCTPLGDSTPNTVTATPTATISTTTVELAEAVASYDSASTLLLDTIPEFDGVVFEIPQSYSASDSGFFSQPYSSTIFDEIDAGGASITDWYLDGNKNISYDNPYESGGPYT